jgi:hypothetical protein
MTLGRATHSIGTVLARSSVPARRSAASATGIVRSSRLMLTRRRAVDFCRVATALCQAAHDRSQTATPRPRGAAR